MDRKKGTIKHKDTKKGTIDTGAHLRVAAGRRKKIKKLPITCSAYYLGDKIVCIPNPHDRQFTWIANLYVHPRQMPFLFFF